MAEVPTLSAGPTAQHHPVAQTFALLNNWIDYVPQQQRRLGLFIFLVAIAHVAAFFFVRIDTTRPEIRHQPRTQVTMDNASDSPEERFWDRMTDPRLYVLPVHAAPQAPDLAAEFQAMEEDSAPAAMPAPAEIGSFPFLHTSMAPLDERVEETMHPARQPFAYAEHARPMLKTTTWQWNDTLAQRQPAGATALPSPVSDTEISPTQLRVGVNPDGTVSNVLLEDSSRVPDLDQKAILAAQKIRFQPTNSPGVQWGMATISWYYTPQPREVAPPSAPLAP